MIRVFVLSALAVLIGLVTIGLLLARSPGQVEHQVFYGGQILLPDGETVQALHVHNGRIAALGDADTLMRSVPWGTRRIDLDGAVLTAGLIEPHTHPLATALLGAATDVSGITHADRTSIMAELETAAQSSGPTPWVIAFGWDPAMMDGLDAPSLAELDSLSPDRPLIILTQMMHEAFINSAAIEAAGLTAQTPDPEGGHFDRDETGALTGRIVEVSAIQAVMAAAPEAPDAALRFLLFNAFNAYADAGYTTIGAASLVGRARDPVALYAAEALAERAVLNTVLYTAPENRQHAQDMLDTPAQSNAVVRLAGIKFWMDGSPYVGGAALAEPYTRSPFTDTVIHLPQGWRGSLLTSAQEAQDLITAANAGGYQVAIHAQGETAIDAALDAIEAAGGGPHRLEHLALITPEQIERANEMGVSLSFFIDHIRFYGHMLPDLVGEARTARYMPVGAALAQAETVTLHGDHPATPINALRVMETATARQARLGGRVLAPDERISRLDALNMMTLSAARQLGLEDETGSIELGKRADLTCFTENPLDAEFADIDICGTWIGGRKTDTRSWSLRATGRMLSAAWAMSFG
ncbi:amidohydrolase [Maricaulis sp. D1M11]|uniref:amidohydrolase n=1 Tax=Maricaulis sp. D1M11 TaxID=3076117 RepID=UPI0039B5CAA2